LFIANQFQASSRVDAVRLADFCIPSTVDIP
jgi:hypothetical protein